jgi:hypothetical protein
MATEVAAQLLAQALRELVRFVDERPGDATSDDDVRALESVGFVLGEASPVIGEELVALLGADFAGTLGSTCSEDYKRTLPPRTERPATSEEVAGRSG